MKRYRVVVPKLGNISDLTDALTKLCAIPGERLVVCDVHQHRFHRVFTSDNTVSHINERDVIYVLVEGHFLVMFVTMLVLDQFFTC